MLPLARALGFVVLSAGPLPALDVEYGVICDIEMSGTEAAPETESGVINLVDQNRAIDVHTSVVPAALGISFGLRVVAPEDWTTIDAEVVLTHPRFDPSGVTQQTWSAEILPASPALNLFTFELPHEMALGTWRFELRDGDDLLAERRFDVVLPDAARGVLDACTPPALIS